MSEPKLVIVFAARQRLDFGAIEDVHSILFILLVFCFGRASPTYLCSPSSLERACKQKTGGSVARLSLSHREKGIEPCAIFRQSIDSSAMRDRRSAAT
jgi:hypothetical protein